MKKRFYIKTAFISVLGVALLSSCLKDPRYLNFAGSPPLVELPGAANVSGTAGYFEVVGLAANATAPTPFNVPVNLAAPKPLGSNLTVKLSVNQAALTAYNTANSTSYVLLPSEDYTSTLSVTIPAGQNLVNLVVNVITSKVDPTVDYVLPLTITDGGGQQISNYNTILYDIKVKNQYDDSYTATGYVFHPSVARAINATYAVTTQGANTCQAPVGDLGGSNSFYFNFDVNGSTVSNWVAAGATPPAPASGFMTLDNPGNIDYSASVNGGPPPSYPGGATYNSTIYNNTYDANKRTFWLHYGYATGGNGQSTFTRQFYEELVAQ